MTKIERLKFEPIKNNEDQPTLKGFQMVKFEVDFYGNIQKFSLDTKITNEEKQLVVDGNGFIKAGTDITNWK